MLSMETSSWGEFKLGKLYDTKTKKTKGAGLFNIINSVAYHGKDIEEANENTLDAINYVTRSKFNNGIKFKVVKKDSYIINPAGTISFGAENADFFYQNEEYITGNKMYYIDTSELSKYSCAFIKSILEATFTANYSFSDGMIPARIYDQEIKLPIDSQGNPDWHYMENYMRAIETKVCAALSQLEKAKEVEANRIDISSWGAFRLKNLCGECIRGTRLTQAKRIDGSTPLVTAGFENEGIAAYIGNPEMTLFGNCLTMDMFGNCFYRDYTFNADDNILCLAQKWQNKYVCMFLASVLNQANYIYDYTNQYRKKNYDKQTIMLPIDSQGNPNWQYMENYMRNIETKVNNSLSKLVLC